MLHAVLRSSLAALFLGCTMTTAAAADPADGTPRPAGDPHTSDNNFADLSLEELMTVQVTSVAGVGQDWFKTPAAMYVVTAEDIRRSGHQLLPEIMRLVPGATVARATPSKWAVGIRGSDELFADKLLVLIDGRRIYDPAFGGVFWDSNELIYEDLDRIEVIRGPGATLWGANAVNGVINVTTKSAKDTQGWYASALTGTDFNALAEARYGGELGDSAWYRAWFKYLDHGGYETRAGTDLKNDWNSLRAGFRLDAETDSDGVFTFDNSLTYNPRIGENLRVPVPGPAPTGSFVLTPRDADALGLNSRVKYRQKTQRGSWSAQAYIDYYNRLHLNKAGYERITVDGQWRQDLRWGAEQRHTLVWGLHFRMDRDDTDDAPDLVVVPTQETHYQYAGFIQDEWELVEDRLALTLGTKLEYNTRSQFEYQPAARLAWTPDDRQTFWGAVSRSVNVPARALDDAIITVARIDLGGPVLPVTLTGNSDLDSEQVLGFEAGYRRRLGQDITLDTALFYNHFEDVIVLPPPPPSTATNDAVMDTFGGELVLTWRPSRDLRVEGSYSYLHMDLDDPGVITKERTPPHQGRVTVGWDVSEKLELNAAAYLVSPQPGPDVNGYARLDLGATWRPRHNIELSVWGQNLIEEDHVEADEPFGPGVINEIPRSVYIQATMRF